MPLRQYRREQNEMADILASRTTNLGGNTRSSSRISFIDMIKLQRNDISLLLLLALLYVGCCVVFTGGFFRRNDANTDDQSDPPIPCNINPNPNLTTTNSSTTPETHREEKLSTEEEKEFWKQPDGLGFVPCLNFSSEYQRSTRTMMAANLHGGTTMRRRFLIVVVAGGLNQQRNQIIDAVVIARILEAALVIPILQVNAIWGDDSKFSDIFDVLQFMRALKEHVRVVPELPPDYLKRKPFTDCIMQFDVNETWIRTRFEAPLKKNKVLVLSGLDSKLSKNIHPDLQKLRCTVAFEALRFRSAIEEVGEKLAARMAEKGPYLALHLRLEKDVWIRTGCLPGLGDDLDREIQKERKANPHLLTDRINLSPHERYLVGHCPLRPDHMARLLKGLGAPANARIYLAGGRPFGGEEALRPLRSEFPNLYDKYSLAEADDLQPLKHKPSLLAAVDYVVCLKSNVFMANHGGNMQRAIQGHRAFFGHRKHIVPNKKGLIQLLVVKGTNKMDEEMMNRAIKKMHKDKMGAPSLNTGKKGRNVIAHPVPACMCKNSRRS